MTEPQPTHVEATFYAQAVPVFAKSSSYWNDEAGNPHLEGAKVTGLTQTRPGRPRPGSVLVKLTLRLPASAFLPLSPEAVVVIPPGYIAGTPIQVIASDTVNEGRRLAASVLELAAIGESGMVREDTLQRILADPVYAADVAFHALEATGDPERVESAMVVLGVAAECSCEVPS